MNVRYLIFSTLALSFALTGCDSHPETPQEVSQDFWAAVIEGDAETAADLSTLVDEHGFDGYSLDWDGTEVSWGRVTIAEREASIETVFSGIPKLKGETLDTTTELVRINDQWLVDYHQTGDEVASDVRLGRLMGSFREFGDRLRSEFNDGLGDASEEFERLVDDLAEFSEESRQEMSSLIEEYGKHLERRLEELSRSLDEALEDNPSASEQDRQSIEDAQKELERQQEALDDKEPDAIAQASKELARIQEQLSELSDRSFDRLNEQLERWSQELNRELEQLNREARMKEQHSI